MKTQELKIEEQKVVNGGSLTGNGLLGNDSNVIKGVSQGFTQVNNTDDSGDTQTSRADFGSGTLLESIDGMM